MDPAQDPNDSWGHSIEHATTSNTLRIATININGLPKDPSHVKNSILREAINIHKLDIIGLSEVNIKWDRIYPTLRLKQRVSGWWETCHSSYAYNYRDISKAIYQPGGTALISLHSTTHRVRSSLSDPTGLGRWTSTLYTGKRNIQLRIIQVYCPPQPSALSHNSSYTQQHRYFLHKQIDGCPRTFFFNDLSDFLQERLQAQEQLIVMGDFNHIINSSTVQHFLSQHHLHNIHRTLHPSYNTNLPTYQRGSHTIDAIFASPGLSAIQGGFLGFRTFPTDHRLLWCDISYTTLFGSPRLTIIPHARRRLKCEDPRTVHKFCTTYHNSSKQRSSQCSSNLISIHYR